MSESFITSWKFRAVH